MATIVEMFRVKRTSDKEQFCSLLRPHIDAMYRMAWHWTRSQDDAEDLVQDVLVTLAKRHAELEHIEALRPWLIRIVYNRYVDLYRKRRASPVDDSVDADELQVADSDDQVERSQLRETLQKALDTLDSDQRDVVLLCDLEGYTMIETADSLNIKVGTVKSRLHRAHEKLQRVLDPGTLSALHT